MKNFTFLLAIALVLGLQSMFAQQVKWGAVAMADAFDFRHRAFVSADPKGCIELRCDAAADRRAFNKLGKFILHGYDDALNVKTTVELLPKLGGKEMRTEFGIEMKGNLYVIASLGDQDARKAFYYAQKLDRKTLTLHGAPMLIGEGNHNQYLAPSFCTYSISSDSSHLMLVTQNSEEFDDKIGISIVDAAMKVQWSENLTFPATGKNPSLQLSAVDNAGNAYIVIGTEEGKSGRKVELYTLRKGSASPQKLPMEVAGGYLSDIQVELDVAGKLLVAGLSTKEGTEVADGYTMYRFDQATLAMELSKSASFSPEFIAAARGKMKASPGLKSYYLKQVIPMSEGRTLLLAECSWDKMGSSVTMIYNDLDIAAIMLSASGEIEWWKVVHKLQIGDNSNWAGSYAWTQTQNGDVILIYNDDPDNIGKPIDAPADNFDFNTVGGVVAKVTISPDGAIKRELLCSNAKPGTMPIPRCAANAGPGKLIIPSEALKKFRLGLLSL